MSWKIQRRCLEESMMGQRLAEWVILKQDSICSVWNQIRARKPVLHVRPKE